MGYFDDCLFLEGTEQIQDYFKFKEKILIVVGKGFDPRAPKLLEALKDVLQNAYIWVIDYEDRGNKESAFNESRSNNNLERIRELCKNQNLIEKSVPQYSRYEGSKVLVISENVRVTFNKDDIGVFSNIIVDMSAMPRAVVFSIIKRLLTIKSENQKLYTAVCENSEWDEKIKPIADEDTAEYLQGFNTFSMSQENSNADVIWIPMLGKNEVDAFNIICNFLDPIEICPAVPFPATDIHRGESLLREYGEVLFRNNNVDRRNVIYVPENNPILVYRKLYDTVCYYKRVLSDGKKTGDEYKYAFSSQSSKLIDLGMLLAVLKITEDESDVKVGIVVIGHKGYPYSDEYKDENSKLYCLCLNDDIFEW